MRDQIGRTATYIYTRNLKFAQLVTGSLRSRLNNFYIRGISIFLNDLERSMGNACYILLKNNGNKTEKTFKNEQRSKDATAKKRPNTSGVWKINYYEDIYIPPDNNTD